MKMSDNERVATTEMRHHIFRPILAFNYFIMIDPGTYLCRGNFVEHKFTINYPSFNHPRKNDSMENLMSTTSIFAETFLDDSKYFSPEKVDHLTSSMDPISREFFEYILVRFYQILTLSFSFYFNNINLYIGFMKKFSINEKIISGSQIFRSTCPTEIFTENDFTTNHTCKIHSQRYNNLLRFIFDTVSKSNGHNFV